jgi:hypothetical protein
VGSYGDRGYSESVWATWMPACPTSRAASLMILDNFRMLKVGKTCKHQVVRREGGSSRMTSAKVSNVKGARFGHLNRRPVWPELNTGRLDTPTVMRETCREDEADHSKHRDEDGEDHT